MVAEHELIEIEKLFGKALNIPIQDENEPTKKQSDHMVDSLKEMESRKINSNRFKDHLLQWRVLFFFQDLQDKCLSEIGNEAKKDKVYLHIKLFDFITSMEIYDKNEKKPEQVRHPKQMLMTPASMSPVKKFKYDSLALEKIKTFNEASTVRHRDNNDDLEVKFIDKAEYLLKKMRIHFFFTEKDANLDDFLNNTQIEIRITDGPNWNKVMYKATCSPFALFKVISIAKFRITLKYQRRLSSASNSYFALLMRVVRILSILT